MYRTDRSHFDHDHHDHDRHDHDHEDDPRFGQGRRGRRSGFGRSQFLPGGFGRSQFLSGSFGRNAVALMGAVRAGAHAEPAQQARIEAILGDARKAIFTVLADAPTPGTDDPVTA